MRKKLAHIIYTQIAQGTHSTFQINYAISKLKHRLFIYSTLSDDDVATIRKGGASLVDISLIW